MEMPVKRLLIAAALALGSSHAAAASCTDVLRDIDMALAKNQKLKPEQRAEAKKSRDDGAKLCYARKEDEAQQVLRKAVRLLELG